MFATALKLGAATGIGYAAGGSLGRSVLKMAAPEAAPDTITAATWAGRATVFLIAAALLTRL
jgi:hypothetical protein